MLIILYQNLMGRYIQVSLGDSHTACGIALRVNIDNQDFLSLDGQTCGQIYIGGCFSYATFLIENSYCFSHFFLLNYL